MQVLDFVRIIAACVLPYTGAMIGVFVTNSAPDRDEWYQNITKPDWTPPSWVYPAVWTPLYLVMGFASYWVWKECGGFSRKSAIPLALYAIQLILNWIWTPLFFGAHEIGGAAIEIVIFGVFVAATMIAFFRVSRLAGGLFIPYLVWACFAAALNITIWTLNRDSDWPPDM